MKFFDHPQDPYKSILVSASAGSGKTFQLSRRFLALVTAGALPPTILTITFSKKAAAEMRSRIIADAIAYGLGERKFEGFHDSIQKWRQAAVTTGQNPPPLLTPKAASDLIVQNTQSLAITTIDSVLMEWSLRFPEETAQRQGDVVLMAPWDIPRAAEAYRQCSHAWSLAVKAIAATGSKETSLAFMQHLIHAAPGGSLKTAWGRLDTLISSDTFIWLSEHLRGEAHLYYDTQNSDLPVSDEELVEALESDLIKVVGLVSNMEKRSLATAALAERQWTGLLSAGILKKDGSLNGTTVSKKIQTALPLEVERIQNLAVRYQNLRRLEDMNAHARLLWLFFHAWRDAYLQVRASAQTGTFSDALKGAYSLFKGDYPGPRWLIQSNAKHLLLDEFQDTSRLQWEAFKELASDLMAGVSKDEATPTGTVFIVGDAKQSIYGFREADPDILTAAFESLSGHGLQNVTMSESWRTAPLLMEVINGVFTSSSEHGGGLIDGFPKHQTAHLDGQPVVPDVASIQLLPISFIENTQDKSKIESGKEVELSGPELDAKNTAAYIHDCLSGKIETPIWDQNEKKLRPPRPADFALLYATATHAHTYENALRSLQIPSRREERRGFFDRQEIRDSVALFRWLALPADTASLCSVLKSPFCNVSDRTLQKLIHGGHDKTQDERKLCAPTQDILSRLEAFDLKLYALLTRLSEGEQASSCFDIFSDWLIKTNGAAKYESLFGELEGPLAKANLLKFLELLRHFEAKGVSSLHDVLVNLTELAQDDETGSATIATDAVHLMTAHKSKGLEFPVVILVDTVSDWYRSESHWVRSSEPGKEGFYYIGTKDERPEEEPQIQSAIKQNEWAQRREKARLLYVAMTRAKQHLVLTGHYTRKKSQPEPPESSYYHTVSKVLRSMGAVETPAGLRLERCSEMNYGFVETHSSHSKETLPLPKPSRMLVPPLKILSVTGQALSSKADASRRTSSVEQPANPVKGPVYGTAVHRCLELISDGQTVDSLTLRKYLLSAQEQAKHLSSEDLDVTIQTAMTDASSLTRSKVWEWLFSDTKSILREVSFAETRKDAHGSQSFVVGQPDVLLEKISGEWWIIDYKTTYVPEGADLTSMSRDLGYFDQLEGYLSGVQKLLPGASVKSYLLYTRNGTLLEYTGLSRL